MLECKSLQRTRPEPPVRTLKIEIDGDGWRGRIKPKIRLMGRWLERAGFKPGNRVQVTCLTRGMIELRAYDTALGGPKSTGPAQSEHPS
jgi:hypothetical protein